MAFDFSNAPQEQGGSLIPENTLAWGVLTIRAKAPEFGKVLHSGKTNPENRYLDCEIEIISGKATGRKIFTKIGIAGSEKWVNQGMAALRHILEVGKNAGPTNPQGYILGANLPDGDERAFMELDGAKVAIKVGIEPGKDGYKDKNDVKSFLSPHPDSPTVKDFNALLGGAEMAETGRRQAVTQPSFAPPVGAAAGAPAAVGVPPAGISRPGWVGDAPQPAAAPNKAPW